LNEDGSASHRQAQRSKTIGGAGVRNAENREGCMESGSEICDTWQVS